MSNDHVHPALRGIVDAMAGSFGRPSAEKDLADADQMLATFKERFGGLPRYAAVIRAIDKLQRGG